MALASQSDRMTTEPLSCLCSGWTLDCAQLQIKLLFCCCTIGSLYHTNGTQSRRTSLPAFFYFLLLLYYCSDHELPKQ